MLTRHTPETTPHHLAAVVAEVEHRAGMAAPMDPYALTAALGLELRPRRGAYYALRGRVLVFDPRWPEHVRLAMLGRACAVFVLWCCGELRGSSHADVVWLTRALTGQTPVAADAGVEAPRLPRARVR